MSQGTENGFPVWEINQLIEIPRSSFRLLERTVQYLKVMSNNVSLGVSCVSKLKINGRKCSECIKANVQPFFMMALFPNKELPPYH